MTTISNGRDTPNTKIVLQTRLGSDVDNLQGWEMQHFEWEQVKTHLNRFKPPFVIFLGASASPVYNCHGLTFGSRRTAVKASNELINRILVEDGFEQVPQAKARQGDVVIYIDDEGEIQHSGIVVEVLQPGVTRVWSKWGRGLEAVHHFGTMPYDNVVTKYYRMCRWKR
jgi:hypothetical protein